MGALKWVAGIVVVMATVTCLVARSQPFVPVSALEQSAKARIAVTSRVPLADEASTALHGLDGEAPGSGHVANYLRALAIKPVSARSFARVFEAFVYRGSLPPALKLAMALRIAQENGSAYTAVHVERLLRASDGGVRLLNTIQADRVAELKPAESEALKYAELLTEDIYGVDDATFRRVRGYFNDAEIVELTFTTCFFNYFTRLTDGLGLPVEPWLFDASVKPPKLAPHKLETPTPRVALISDAEMQLTSAALGAATKRGDRLGLGMANSQRAMMRVPELAQTWSAFAFGQSTGESTVVTPEIQLQVSFAVSMANGCRYCTMHQVLGLRRLGVDPGKLLAMEKSDDALTPRERQAVTFARKLTHRSSGVTEADYQALQAEFKAQGALEVVMQASTFNFMNRFTDGLRLPSEDEAVRVYKEVYGKDFVRQARPDPQ
jgi:AhpD family alkylhydroperoxidase